VFTSDHGDFMGEFNMVRKGMFMYDALMHVPMIWYAPGKINKGVKLDALAQNVDIYPTLLDLAGVELPNDIAGHSLKKILKGEEKEVNEYVFAAAAYSELPPNYWDNPEPYYSATSKIPFHTRVEQITWQEEKMTAMVRNKNWKLIVSETDKPELYFMDGENIERKNLFGTAKYNAVYQELKKAIQENWDWNFRWE
jgi:arylsulfatase A-like enzyme